MNSVSSGDLAQRFALRRQMAELKTELTALTSESTTGVTSDVSGKVSGDFTALAGLNRSLQTLGALQVSANEAGVMADTMQDALGIVHDMITAAAPNLLQAGSLLNPTQLRTASVDARQKFSTVVAALNVQTGGRTVFGGIETGGPALASSNAMLDELLIAAAAETTATGIEIVVNDWFDLAGGGFETSGYLGNTERLGDFQITSSERVGLAVTADDPEIRAVLKALAMASLITQTGVAGNDTEGAKLAKKAGEAMLSAQQGLLNRRADVGLAQESIENASLRNSAEKASLEILRSRMLGVDPYDAQTALEATQNQLEAVYAVTARLASLSLVDFLR